MRYIPKSKMVVLVDWRLVFGHSLPPLHSGGRLLGASVCAMVVVDHRMPTPCSQDQVGALYGLCGTSGYEESAFYVDFGVYVDSAQQSM